MKRSPTTLLLGARTWRVGVRDDDGVHVRSLDVAGASAAEAAGRARAVLLEEGYKGGGLILALPSGWCLSGTISTDGLLRQNRRESMTYRLEEQLPCSAEDVVADFTEAGNRAFGVCVPIERVLPIVRALNDEGIQVEAICPAVLLGCQGADDGNDDCDLLLWGNDDRVDAITFDGTTIRSWWLLDGTEEAVRLGVQVPAGHRAPEELRVLARHVGENLTAALSDLRGVELRVSPSPSVDEAATKAAADLLAGRTNPLLDLKRDALDVQSGWARLRRPVTFALAGAVFLFLALNGAFLWRTYRYGQEEEGQLGQHRTIYEKLFPGRDPGPDVRRRLQSERRRLMATSGATHDAPRTVSAIDVLGASLSRLPHNRIKILEIRVEGPRVSLEGEAPDHGTAGLIAMALGKDETFEVESFPTEEIRGRPGVTFAISATYDGEKRP